MARSKPLLIAALGALVAATAAGSSVIRFNAADQRSAHTVVLKAADLGTPGWTGGAKKPDLSSGSGCKSFNPKDSDLVTTGAAETVWRKSGLTFDSEVEILQTAEMVSTDWQRSVKPQAVTCIREQFNTALKGKATLISAARVAVPSLATYTAAYRVVFETQGIRFATDVLLVGRSRTEITLTTVTPYVALQVVRPAELRLARLMLARATA